MSNATVRKRRRRRLNRKWRKRERVIAQMVRLTESIHDLFKRFPRLKPKAVA